MKATVIGDSIHGIDNLSSILCGFDPAGVMEKFGDEGDRLLDEIVEKLHPLGRIRRTSRSIWPHYCRTILSAANFLSQFASADDFYRWADQFDKDERTRPALPMLLDNEIDGFGFALACDFLKGLGYFDYAKPDVHLRDIFCGVGICKSGINDYSVFKAIIRMAGNVGKRPYHVDKLFWLIGSGKFYDDKNIGVDGEIGNHKTEFIEFVNRQLY